MAALTSLMTRFCAGEDSWLARNSTSPVILALPKQGTETIGPEEIKTSVRETLKMPKTRWSTPDSVAPSPVNGRGHSKETKTVHLAWTEYSIDLARFTAPMTSLLTIPTEVVGSLKRPEN